MTLSVYEKIDITYYKTYYSFLVYGTLRVLFGKYFLKSATLIVLSIL